MSNELVQQLAALPALPAAAAALKSASIKLSEGIAAPFAIIGYKGGKWSIRHRGKTETLYRYNAQGQQEGALPFLDLVVVDRAPTNAKAYYATAYTEGDDKNPDCWSDNGVTPALAVENKQSASCLNCKWNQFGSRVNQATGGKGKACADIRRLAVVPAQDIKNELLGGPMLLRIPPASLGAFGAYGDALEAAHYPFSALATRVGFDLTKAYPLMTFQVLRALTAEEIQKVLEVEKNPLVERILNASEEVPPAGAPVDPKPLVPPTTPVTNVVTPPPVNTQAPLGSTVGLAVGAAVGAAVGMAFGAAPATVTPEPVVQVKTPEELEREEFQKWKAQQAAQANGIGSQSTVQAAADKPPRKTRTRTPTPSPVPTEPAAVSTNPPAQAEAAPEDGGDDGDSGLNDPAIASISARLAALA